MTLNLEEAEKLARAATPGEWYVAKVFSGKIQADLLFIRSRENTLTHNTDHAIAEVFGGTGPRPHDARYIAHMYPERTLAYVARIRELETSASGREETNRQVTSELVQLVKERDELAAYAEGLKAAVQDMFESAGTNATSTPSRKAFLAANKTLTTPPPAFLQSQREKMERVKDIIRFYAEGNHTPSEWSSGEGNVGLSGGEDGRKAREALKLLGEA